MRNIVIAIIISITALFSSCCKEGINGDARVTALIKHHDNPIYGATVYIKFNAKDKPANLGDFDVSYTASPGDSVVVIDNLRCGDYYFFATGFDPSISKAVDGGIPYTIRYGDRKQQIQVNIPVTEEH